MDGGKIKAAMAAGTERSVALKQPLPIYLVYFTRGRTTARWRRCRTSTASIGGISPLPVDNDRQPAPAHRVPAAGVPRRVRGREIRHRSGVVRGDVPRRNDRVPRRRGHRPAGRVGDVPHRGGPPGDYTAATADGTLVQQGLQQWTWTAPDRPGTYLVTFDGPGKKDRIAVHGFVMVPATEVKGGLLNGYRIGQYPAAPLNGNPIYSPPAGFIEVTKENQNTRSRPTSR